MLCTCHMHNPFNKAIPFQKKNTNCLSLHALSYLCKHFVTHIPNISSKFVKINNSEIFRFFHFSLIIVMHCVIWYQMLKSSVRMVVLTSQNGLERLSQESVSPNPFAWHSNSYLTFNHSHGMYMTSEWNANSISRKNCPIRKVL